MCVWRLKDHSCSVISLPDLVTTLQWRRGQSEGDTPLLLAGLLNGGLVMVEVERVGVSLPLDLKVTELDQLRLENGGEEKERETGRVGGQGRERGRGRLEKEE